MTALAPALKICKYELSDVIRSKWVMAYGLFFLAATELLFRFGSGGGQVLLSLLNVVLILVPLVCLVFGTMYLYHARDFIELMLAQPVRRGQLFGGLYAGLAAPLAAGYVLGVGVPFALHGVGTGHVGTLAMLLATGVLLTAVFTAVAFFVATRMEDRVKGLGVAVLLWLVATVVYDGAVLAVAHAFADYPLERPMIGLALLNPVDLGRILLLLQFDVSALMGYTGAVFERFFGTAVGLGLTLGTLALWCALPLGLGLRVFRNKDF